MDDSRARLCLQLEGDILIWIMVGQELTMFVVGAGGGCLDIFSLAYYFSFLSTSPLDGWMDDLGFYVLLAQFHLYQDAGWVMDGCVQWKNVYN